VPATTRSGRPSEPHSGAQVGKARGFVAEGDHDFPAVGVADHGTPEHVPRPSGDLLEQLHHLRAIGGHPEPSLGGKRLGDIGEEVRLRSGCLVRAERGALKRGLDAQGLGHH
jgi:hypothetical protein